jgi:hypothetical protein
VTTNVTVDPRSRKVLRPGDLVQASYAAALVQLDGSVGAVEQQIEGALGEGVAACATRAADHWYFAAGSTDQGAQLLVSLFNPFPGDAIVDFTFATDTGPFTPADLQGVIVPGRSVTVVDVGQHVRRRSAVSTSITARTGQVVADKIELLGGTSAAPAAGGGAGSGAPSPAPSPASPASPPATGAAAASPASAAGVKAAVLALGVSAAGTQWYFPDGVATDGVNETYEIYNPTDHEANVQLSLLLERGSADPFQLVVAAHDRVTVQINKESRIPKGVAHAATAESTNGVAFVVDRVITASPPSTHAGVSDISGAPSAAAHWLFPAGAANDGQDEWLVVLNPGTVPTRLSVTALLHGQNVAVDGLQQVEVAPGQRLAMRLGDHLTSGELITSVDAEGPVVVERDLYRVGGPGLSASLGIPAPG